jgi:hypothetical protein
VCVLVVRKGVAAAGEGSVRVFLCVAFFTESMCVIVMFWTDEKREKIVEKKWREKYVIVFCMFENVAFCTRWICRGVL